MAKLLSHEELGISFAEYGALIATRTMLACGVLVHGKTVVPHEHHFNMAVLCKVGGNCGTLSCIGGTMALIMGYDQRRAADYIVRSKGELENLFFPSRPLYRDLTTKQALAAIDNYLTTGQAQWNKCK